MRLNSASSLVAVPQRKKRHMDQHKDLSEIQAQSTAIREIERLLITPDDLNQLPTLRANFLRRRSILEQQLRDIESSRLDQASLGCIFGKNCSLWSKLCRRYELTDNLLSNSHSGIILQTENIVKLICALRNLNETDKALAWYESLPDEISELNEITSKPPRREGIFEIYLRIIGVERLRDITLLETVKGKTTGKNSPTDRDQVKMMFSDVPKWRTWLEIFLWETVSDLFDCARFNPRRLVGVMRIIDQDENEYQWWLRYAESHEKEEYARKIRPPRNYKKKLFHSLRTSFIKNRFRSIFETLDQDDANLFRSKEREEAFIQEVIEGANRLTEDHEEYNTYVVPCVPPNYQIDTFLMKEYNHLFFVIISRILHRKTEHHALSVVKIIAWYTEYRNKRIQEGCPSRLVSFDLNQNDKEILALHYQQYFYEVMNTLIEKIINDDTKKDPISNAYVAIRRSTVYGSMETKSPEELFTAVKRQIVEASLIAQESLMVNLIDTATDVLLQYQKKLEDVLGQIKPSVDFLSAVVNNASRSLDYAEQLKSSLFELISEEFHFKIDQMDTVIDGFHEQEAVGMNMICDIIIADIYSILSSFFTDQSDYGLMLDLLDTLKDWLTDLQDFLLKHHVDSIMLNILKLTINGFLEPFFLGKKIHMKPSSVVKNLQTNYEKLRTFFYSYIKPSLVDAHLRLLTWVKELYTCAGGIQEVLNVYQKLLDYRPDFSSEAIRSILESRSDISKAEVQASFDQFFLAHKAARDDFVKLNGWEAYQALGSIHRGSGANAKNEIVENYGTLTSQSDSVLKWQSAPDS